MGAPKGNQFWKLRSKHGRDTLFANPEMLWDAATEYFEWCEQNPLIEVDYKGKDAVRVEIPKMRAFTLEGLCLYLGCNTAYFRNFRCIDEEREKDFDAVFTRIYETIRNQKFVGAASGFFNATIIARDLGLRDQTDVTTGGDKITTPAPINVYTNGAPPLSGSEDEIEKSIEKK